MNKILEQLDFLRSTEPNTLRYEKLIELQNSILEFKEIFDRTKIEDVDFKVKLKELGFAIILRNEIAEIYEHSYYNGVHVIISINTSKENFSYAISSRDFSFKSKDANSTLTLINLILMDMI